ncbi:MAG: sensor histidine kinase [Pseudomonadota bacterium]
MFWRMYSKYRWAYPYLFAFAVTVLAIAWSMHDQAQVQIRIFRFLYPAGFFSVWFGGLGAGLFSVLLGTLVYLYLSFFDPSFGTLSSGLWDLAMFVGFGTTFGILIDREKKLRKRVQQTLKELKVVARQVAEREKDLSAALRSRDDFFSIASHELKTPITALKLQMQLLTKQLQKTNDKEIESKLLPAFRLMEGQISRLTNLVESLLDITRMAKGGLKLDLEELVLSDLVQEVCERYSELLKSTGCTYEIREGGSSRLRCDRFRMEQVFTNLITNSSKYAPNEKILIEFKNTGDHLQCIFQDSGPGIIGANADEVFAPFRRRSNSEPKVPGLGLGLFIVRQIIQAHTGEIKCESPLGKKGTRFVMSLPLKGLSETSFCPFGFDGENQEQLNFVHQRYAFTFSD